MLEKTVNGEIVTLTATEEASERMRWANNDAARAARPARIEPLTEDKVVELIKLAGVTDAQIANVKRS